MLHSRIERVQSLLLAEIAAILDQELKNPNLPLFITVHEVKVSKDLAHALVKITFLQDQSEEVIKQTVEELNHSAGYVGRLLASRVQLRRHPRLKFIYTDSTRFALDMEHLFQEMKREDAPKGSSESS
jgi:ribosome-binding factor A